MCECKRKWTVANAKRSATFDTVVTAQAFLSDGDDLSSSTMLSSLLPFAFRLSTVAAFISLLLACAAASPDRAADGKSDDDGRDDPPALPARPSAPVAKGEVVAELPANIWYAFQDKAGNYWFGSDGHGLYRYDGETITQFTKARDGLANDYIRGIQQHGPTGDMLITTLGEVSKFDGRRFTTLPVRVMAPPDVATLPNNGWELNPDDVWLPWQSKQNGPYRYDGKTLYHLKFPKHPREDAYYAQYPNKAWSPYEVYCVYKDRKGNMWFGTSNFGICRFDGKTLDWMYEDHLTNTPEGGSFGIRSIIEDHNGAYWFCNTQFRYMIQPHDAAAQSSGEIVYTRESGIDLAGTSLKDKYIYFMSIAETEDGDLWLATYDQGVWRYDGKTIKHYPVKDGDKNVTLFTISKDNRGDLWLGTHAAGAYKFNGTAFERFRP